jgi:hypothetical protein
VYVFDVKLSLSSVLLAVTDFGFYRCGGSAIGKASCGGFCCQLRSARRKNLQEIHFKPPPSGAMDDLCISKTKR